MHKSVAFEELLALYAVSDACVIASTRDGMNLVSFEYIACQQNRHGSLVLSEFAGSAASLTGSIVVNPWNIDEMARAMAKALTMEDWERTERFEQMNGYVQNNTRYVGAPSFFGGPRNICTESTDQGVVARFGVRRSSKS